MNFNNPQPNKPAPNGMVHIMPVFQHPEGSHLQSWQKPGSEPLDNPPDSPKNMPKVIEPPVQKISFSNAAPKPVFNTINNGSMNFGTPQPISSGVWSPPKAESILKKNNNPYSTRRGV